MSDIITTKRQINGEPGGPVSGNGAFVERLLQQADTELGVVAARGNPEAAIEQAEPAKRPPGRPKGSKTDPEKLSRTKAERERQRIRDERAFEIEREEAERRYEVERLRAEHAAELERAQREFEFSQERAALENQTKRVAPRDPLRAWVLSFTLGLALLILAASAVFSFATIADAAQWLQPSWPWLVWLLPIATEFFIVFGGMDTLISQARGDKKGARTGLAIMLAASLVAVIANGAHTLSEWEQGSGLDDWRAWVGIGLSALIPIATVVASKRAINLVFAKGV